MASNEKPKPPRWRKLKRFLLATPVLLALFVLAFPWWSPWVAKPLAEAFSPARLGAVEAVAWDHWRLTDLTFEQDGLAFRAAEAEIPSPAAWILSRLQDAPPEQPLFLRDWALALPPPAATAEPAPPPAPGQLLQTIERVQAVVFQHIRQAEALDGSIRQGDALLLQAERLALQPEALEAELSLPNPDLSLSLSASLPANAPWSLQAQVPERELAANLAIDSRQPNIALQGQVEIQGNTLSLQGNWNLEEPTFVPSQASLAGQGIVLDRRYPFWPIDLPLAVDANAQWSDGSYSYRIQSSPTQPSPEAPQLDLSGYGTLERLVLETANVELPWLALQSGGPLALDFTAANPLENIELDASLNLDRLPFVETRGSLQALLTTQTSDSGDPIVNARLSGEGILFFDTTIETLSARLQLLDQSLRLESLSLSTSGGSQLAASGLYAIDQGRFQSFTADATIENESERLRQLLPIAQWERLSLAATGSGPPANPSVQATLGLASLQLPQLQPFALDARIDGTLEALALELDAARDTETLQLAADLSLQPERLQATIRQLDLGGHPTFPSLALKQPSSVQVDFPTGGLTLGTFALFDGSAPRFAVPQLAYSPDGLVLALRSVDFPLHRFNAWLANPLPPVRISELDTSIQLSPQRAAFVSVGEATWDVAETSNIEASWRLRQNEDTAQLLQLDHLEIGSLNKHIVRGKGAFPFALRWQNQTLAPEFLPQTPFTLSLQSSPHPDFWRSIETLVPVAVSRPVIRANLSGTLQAPEGQLDLQLDSLRWKHPESEAKNLVFTGLSTSVHADQRQVVVDTLKASLGGNRIEAAASLPLGDFKLTDLFQQPAVPDISQADGKATISLQDLNALQAWLPDFLRRDGKATIEVDLKPNDVTAVAEFSKFATRPLPPLGSLADVGGRIQYANGVWRTDGVSGVAEQSKFTLSGSVDLASAEQPLYDLAFRSKEFPIVRSSGILLSGDIDLALDSNQENGQPSLTGSVNLTKGLVLVEPEILASNTTTTTSRPPYFAVETDPFRDWGLDVEIAGERFLRVSNSFFEGSLSADFNLEGTLGAPLLIGRAEANTGRIYFPASSLNLAYGEALITRERPSEIQIEANANGRLFNYDINLSTSGSLTDPDVVITTNPALTQVEALLLLTTGAVPDTQTNLAQQSASSIGMFIGKGLFRKLTGSTGSDSASRLSLEVGKDISQQGKKTIEASYQLTDDLAIEGEYDKRDEYNANLIWTFFEK